MDKTKNLQHDVDVPTLLKAIVSLAFDTLAKKQSESMRCRVIQTCSPLSGKPFGLFKGSRSILSR